MLKSNVFCRQFTGLHFLISLSPFYFLLLMFPLFPFSLSLLQAIDWVAREEERPGVVAEQLEQVPV